ncbi:hypothetical protein FRC01_002101 [Tulasnella sp. 417]|nr:hypothetical protein FRC01_002101 [Tulasnella sp. 417]
MSSQLATSGAMPQQPDNPRSSARSAPAMNRAWAPPSKKSDHQTNPPLGAPQARSAKQRGPRPLTIAFPMFRWTASEADPGLPLDFAVPEARSANSTTTSRSRGHRTTASNSERRRAVYEVDEGRVLDSGMDPDAARAQMDGADRAWTTDGDTKRRAQQEGPPQQGKKPRRIGYYRLYGPAGAVSSADPAFADDRSLSSFDIEHVPPPRLAQNYIAYISHRENLNPSGVKMYLTPEQGSPELVTNLDTVIVMDGAERYCGQSKRRPLLFTVEISHRRYPSLVSLRSVPHLGSNSELPVAYYRLYGVAGTSSGAQRPMPSRGPIYDTDPSLASFFIDYVPPPLQAKDYIAYICELEGIHPSRVTLFMRTRAVREGGRNVAEAQEIQSDEAIITARTASLTSEHFPIMVNVQLEVGAYGEVDLGTKNTPLSSLSAKGIARKLNKGLSKWQNRHSVVY